MAVFYLEIEAHPPLCRPTPPLCPRLQLLVHAGAALAEMNRDVEALRAQLATQEAALLQVSATAAQRVAQLEHELRSRGLAVPAPLPPPILTPSPSSGPRATTAGVSDSSGVPATFMQSAAGGGGVAGGHYLSASIDSSAAPRDLGAHSRPGSRFAGPDALPFSMMAEQVTRQRGPSDGSESDGREAHQQAPAVSQARSPSLQSQQQLQQQHFQMQPQHTQQLHFAPGIYLPPQQHSAYALQQPGFMAPGPALQLSHAAPQPPAPAPLPSAASVSFLQHFQQQQQQQHQSLMQSRLQPPPGILAALQQPPEHAFPPQQPQQLGPAGAPPGHSHGPHGAHGAAFMLGTSSQALPLQPPQAFLRGAAAQQPASLPPGLMGQSHGPPAARWQ